MKLPFSLTAETVGTIISYLGIGVMALSFGYTYGPSAAIAAFALGVPILSIQRHMRHQIDINHMTVQLLAAVNESMRLQMASEKLTRAAVNDVRQLLTRVAEEGITRE